MKFFTLRATTAAALLAIGSSAFAADADAGLMKQMESVAQKVAADTGVQFSGYMRSGFYGASDNASKGGYKLGDNSRLGFYRLGNEGDSYMEVGMTKKFDLGSGVKWSTTYMPYIYNGGTGAAQAFTDVTGLEFAPNLTFWVGQRYHRIADIHFVDNWVMQDGDNYGAGVDGIALGSAKLNVALHTDSSMGNGNASPNNAKRVNLQLRDIDTNAGGKLNLTAAMISGTFAKGSAGGALGLLHTQSNFITSGLGNNLFVQTSNGHADLDGKFKNLDTAATSASIDEKTLQIKAGNPATPNGGIKQTRIADTVNWQMGPFGGQAIIGFVTATPDGSATTKHFSLGGRMSYGVAKNVKLLAEVAGTNAKTDGMATMSLNKGALAVALSPNTDYWTRPEIRIYATRVNWNDAAKASGGNFAGRNSATTFGVQVEAWW